MPEIIPLLEQALKRHQGGDFCGAKELYERVLSQNPKHPDALYLSGILLQQMGEPQAAIDRLKIALSHASGNPVILYNLATIYFEQGLIENSIKTYEQVLEIEPNHTSSLNNLGSIYFSLNPEISVKCFLKSYELDPANPQSLCNLSLALDLSLRKSEAFELLRQRFSFFSQSLLYWSTLSTVIDGLDYECCTKDQKEFLESLYESEFLNLDKLNQVLKPFFVRSLVETTKDADLKKLPSIIARYLKASAISSDLEETMLLELRKLITLKMQDYFKESEEDLLALLEAIAVQEFKLEFSSYLSDEEREKLQKFEGNSTLELLLKACYTKLSRSEIELLSQTRYRDLYESYKTELEIQEIPISCFDLSDSTSKKVASHYEEDPYPKWCFVQKFDPTSLSQFLQQRLGNRETVSSVTNSPAPAAEQGKYS